MIRGAMSGRRIPLEEDSMIPLDKGIKDAIPTMHGPLWFDCTRIDGSEVKYDPKISVGLQRTPGMRSKG